MFHPQTCHICKTSNYRPLPPRPLHLWMLWILLEYAYCFHLETGNMGWKLAFSKSFCVLYSMASLLFQLWVVLYSPNSTTTPIPTLADAKLLLSYLGCQIHLLTLCFNIIFIFIKFIFIAMILVIVSLMIVDVAMGKKIREMKSPKRLLRTMPGGRKLWQYCCWGRGRHPSLPSWHPIKSRIRQLFSTSVPV